MGNSAIRSYFLLRFTIYVVIRLDDYHKLLLPRYALYFPYISKQLHAKRSQVESTRKDKKESYRITLIFIQGAKHTE